MFTSEGCNDRHELDQLLFRIGIRIYFRWVVLEDFIMPTNTAERIGVVGLPGMGKTVWCQKYAEEYAARHEGILVVDPIESFKISRATIFHVTNRSSGTDEVELLLKRACVEPHKQKIPLKQRYRLLVLDECSRYYPHSQPLPEQIGYINDFNRHMDLSLVWVARRIVQVNVDLAELSHRLIVFSQKGLNDIKRLNDIQSGMGDLVESLKKYEYVELNADRELSVNKPLNF